METVEDIDQVLWTKFVTVSSSSLFGRDQLDSALALARSSLTLKLRSSP